MPGLVDDETPPGDNELLQDVNTEVNTSPLGAVAAASHRTLSLRCVLTLSIPVEELMNNELSPNEAFILSRLGQEPMTLAELTSLCPLDEEALTEIVERHLESGIVAIAT